MLSFPAHLKSIHQKALALSETYKRSEAELLNAIIEVREQKIYRYFECTSVYEYCVKILKLDPGVVYGFTAVAKKIKEVPELLTEVESGHLNVSTARRITSVLTEQNSKEWFEKAQTLSVRKLEKDVVRENPKAEVRERTSYLNSKRVQLQVGLSETLMLKLRRIQDLESQKQRRSVDLEETLTAMAEAYLHKHDPVERAKRAVIRTRPSTESRAKTVNPATWRKSEGDASENSVVLEKDGQLRSDFPRSNHRPRPPIPARTIHQVHHRDKGRCQYINKSPDHRGVIVHEQCNSTRFIEIHHKKPISQGGANDLANLTTLCSEHHKIEHCKLGDV